MNSTSMMAVLAMALGFCAASGALADNFPGPIVAEIGPYWAVPPGAHHKSVWSSVGEANTLVEDAAAPFKKAWIMRPGGHEGGVFIPDQEHASRLLSRHLLLPIA